MIRYEPGEIALWVLIALLIGVMAGVGVLWAERTYG